MNVTTITYAGGPVMTPDMALTASYAAQAESRVISHDILDGPPVHTLRPASTPTGTLSLLFDDETAATDCWRAHHLAALFTITDTTRALLNFDYVATDRPGIELDPQARRRWVVTVPYREVP